MVVLKISGIIFFLLGVILVISGLKRCVKNIRRDKIFISAEGEIIDYQVRKVKIKYNFFIKLAEIQEYSPLIRYTTNNGYVIESADLPYTLKISPDFRKYEQYRKTGERIIINYDPENPEKYFYKSRTFQFIREVIYKIILGILLSGLGTAIFLIAIDVLI